MITNPLIHIGYHKTGTTWLQNKLFHSGNEYFEILSKKKKGPCTLAENFFVDNNGYLLSPFDFNDSVIKAEIHNIIKNSKEFKDKIPVLSHERLSGNPHVSGFDSRIIADRLYRIFPNGKIFLMIREQKSFVISSYFQYLFAGGTNSLEEYLNENYDGRKPGFSPNYITYNNLVNYYIHLFGKSNVLVLPYEMFSTNSKLFLKQLSNFIGIDVKVKEDDFDIVINKKKNLFIKYKLRNLNVFIKSTSLNNFSFLHSKVALFISLSFAFILKVLIPRGYEKNVKKRLFEKVKTGLGDRYENDNKELSQIINIDLSKYGYHK